MEFYISTRRRVKLHSDVLWRALMRKPRSEYPSEQADKFLVRLPDGMRDRLAEAAKVNKRSMNAEIVARLQASFEPTVRTAGGLPLTDEGLETMLSLAADTRRVVEEFKRELNRAEEMLLSREEQDREARERTKPNPE